MWTWPTAKVWVVGHWVDETRWQLVGVFVSEAAAVGECRTPDYFAGPVDIGDATHDVDTDWEGCYYPVIDNRAAQ